MIKKSQKLNFTAQKTVEIAAIRISINQYELAIILFWRTNAANKAVVSMATREMTVVNLQPYKG